MATAPSTMEALDAAAAVVVVATVVTRMAVAAAVEAAHCGSTSPCTALCGGSWTASLAAAWRRLYDGVKRGKWKQPQGRRVGRRLYTVCVWNALRLR